jgi:hypothetical protein
MIHYRSLTVLAGVAFFLIFSMTAAQAGPPLKEGNPGLPGCLAQVNQLQQTIADQQATITTLEHEINILNASLKYKLPKTGQKWLTYDWAPGSDGELQLGMAWPDPRFTDNGDGTVTDNMTNLIWMKNTNIFGFQSWYAALIDCHNLVGGWRLPNILELLSLVDFNYEDPYAPGFVAHGALPHGHPFTNITEGYYWTSTIASDNFGIMAWRIAMGVMGGDVSKDGQAAGRHLVWCVRDPQ